MSFIIHELLSGYLQMLLSLWLPIKSVVLKISKPLEGISVKTPLGTDRSLCPGGAGGYNFLRGLILVGQF